MTVDVASASSAAASAAAVATTSVLTNPAVHAATRAALELVVSSGVGIAAIDRGLLTAATVKALSTTTFSILLPLFLGTSILKTITRFGLTKSSLAVPVLAALQCFLLYQFTTGVLFRLFLNQDERGTDVARGTAVCASFGNGGVVPLIFCDSLFRNSETKFAQSTGLVSMFLVGWSPFFWSFGRSVLLGSDSDSKAVAATSKRKEELLSFVNTLPITGSDSNAKGVATTIFARKEELMSFVKTLLPAPVMGVLIGMVIATIPILQRLFMGDGKSSVAPLGVVFDTAANFGKAASPLSLLVLVSSLALGAGFGSAHKDPTSISKNRSTDAATSIGIPFWKRWAVVSFSRFVVSPCLMLGLLATASSPRINWIGASSEQPMLWFVCLLESCMPPAQNQVMMLHSVNKMKQANEMATFLFSVYATSMIPLTIVISIALDKFGLI